MVLLGSLLLHLAVYLPAFNQTVLVQQLITGIIPPPAKLSPSAPSA